MAENKPNKIKIALVAPSMRVVGGQSIQANRLLTAFENDAQIQYEFIPNDPPLKILEFARNIPLLKTLATSVVFWLTLIKKIPKADAVHVFSSGTTSYIISTLPPLFIAKLFGAKTILHYHTGEAEKHLKQWRLTARPTMKMFDRIVVPSEFLVEIFARHELKAAAIYNFIDTEKFVFRERRPLKPIFLSNRNFEKHYSVATLLRAFALIQKQFPESRLIIAGSGSEESALKNLARELKLQNTEFIGKIENEKMPDIYNRADIYLNSSIVDNMPLSVIEAFACGLPIVSTDAGGIPHIVENGATGLLAAVNDHENLAKSAIDLLKNDDLAQIIIHNAQNKCRQYEVEKVVEDWRSFYVNVGVLGSKIENE